MKDHIALTIYYSPFTNKKNDDASHEVRRSFLLLQLNYVCARRQLQLLPCCLFYYFFLAAFFAAFFAGLAAFLAAAFLAGFLAAAFFVAIVCCSFF